MICLVQLLYADAWEGKRTLECKGKECRWYGGQDCYAAEKDAREGDGDGRPD